MFEGSAISNMWRSIGTECVDDRITGQYERPLLPSAARLLLRQLGRIPVRKLAVGERNPDGQAATLA